ncbi:MAG: hypothetical protein ABJN22_12850 [Litorimonas sp.]
MPTLSGFWAGVYAYPNDPAPAVNFDCELLQSGSVVTGQITESHAPGQMLVANINGHLTGFNISFIKTYQTTHSNFLWEIAYDGTVSPKKDEIIGVWRVGGRQGTFNMHRDAGILRESEIRKTSNKKDIKVRG